MGTCGLCRLDIHNIIKKHRMMFYWRLVHSTSNFLHDILWCYFGEHSLCESELLVILNIKSSSINDIYEHFPINGNWHSAQDSGHVRSFSDPSVISMDFDIQMQNLHSNFTYVWSSLVLASITGRFGWYCPIFCAFGGFLLRLF